ncbi:helix-turn-helix domain-containing protein [Phytoactinopolyspora halotolerans]|uniref:helix-turn-helix domain-containing protein n=1 Tax=Phytoactinopolyspora halotolerans TaxID=1981512 RepID=UPI0028AA8531|nr:helix-turn-helix transcriptional regulator [Phytoactinopolyspora halotolerans]
MVDRQRPEYERLRTVLRELRREAGLNQTELAERLRVRQEWVSRYEVGERRLDVIELVDVANALGVTLDDILERASIRHG